MHDNGLFAGLPAKPLLVMDFGVARAGVVMVHVRKDKYARVCVLLCMCVCVLVFVYDSCAILAETSMSALLLLLPPPHPAAPAAPAAPPRNRHGRV